MSDPAKLHSLGLKLAETRRELIRSRTVTRIIRSAYRLDDFGASTETIPARFLMLVVGSMTCDCAAIFYYNNINDNFNIIESVGCLKLLDTNAISISITDNSLIINKISDDFLETDIARFMNAEKILCVSDTKTGYAIAIGFHYNSTINHQFDLNDQETMRDTLAVYTDIVERRRTRRLLEQASQNAEARETEINDVVSTASKRMLNIVKELENKIMSLSNNKNLLDLDSEYNITEISNLLEEIKNVVSVTSEITEKQTFPMAMEKEWVLLSEFLTSVVRNTQQACIQQGVDVQLKNLEIKLYVWLDRIWMEMIINTLISEVLSSFTSEGELHINVNQHEDKMVIISIQGHNHTSTVKARKNEGSSNIVKSSQVSASIRRLIEAHNANVVIKELETGLISIQLYINDSEYKNS